MGELKGILIIIKLLYKEKQYISALELIGKHIWIFLIYI